MKEVVRIWECIDSLSQVQENAILQSMGINPGGESSEGCSESDEDEDENIDPSTNVVPLCVHTTEELLQLLKLSRCNWFELVDRVMEQSNESEEATVAQFEKIFPAMMASDLGENEKHLIEESHQAFNLDRCNSHLRERVANALNGMIVTDSESDDPDAYLEIHDLSGVKARALIAKKRKAIR